jgi:Domain of unknown function (DUF4129)
MALIFRKHAVAVGLMVLAAHLFLFPLNVAAIPVSEYQQNLKHAVAALETLYDMDEDDAEYDAKFHQTIEAIRTTLPQQQAVEIGEESIQVNNAEIHHLVEQLEQSEEQIDEMRQLIDKLNAIEQRVADRQAMTASGESKGWAKSRLESILARPEYATGERGPNALTRLLRDIIAWFENLFPKPKPMEPARAMSLSWVVLIIVIACAALVLLYVAKLLLTKFRVSKKYKAPGKREARIVLGERLEPEQTSTNLLSEAESLAKRGELRAAIRKAYIALLVELGDRKIISLAQHKTNRDYLRGLRDVPQLHSQMRGLTDRFERHWYGFAEASENDWQEFRAGYLAALQTGK